MKKTLSIVLCVLLVLLAVACSPETKTHEHNYVLNEEKSQKPTCTNEGYEYWECECGERRTMVVAADPENHKWNDGVVETKATCIAEGKKVYTCDLCKKTYNETIAIDPYNHVEGYTSNAKVVLYPTCATEGYGTLDCAACKKTGVKYTIEKTEEHYKLVDGAQVKITKDDVKEGDWVYSQKSTAFVKGARYGICPICGKANAVSDTVDYDASTVLGEYSFKDDTDDTYNQYTFTVSVDKNGVYSVEAYKMDATTETPSTSKITTNDVGFVDLPENDAFTGKGENSRAFSFTFNTNQSILIFENDLAQATEGSGHEDAAVYAVYKDDSTYTNRGKVVAVNREHNWQYVEGTRVTGTKHTVSCASCGLKNYFGDHELLGCKACNYDENKWYKVIVRYIANWNDSSTSKTVNDGVEVETYYLKNGVSVKNTITKSTTTAADYTKTDGSVQSHKGYSLNYLKYENNEISQSESGKTYSILLGLWTS